MKRNASVTMTEAGHRYVVRVYYEDTDAGGVVYHASYLRYAERARTEALRDLGVPHAELLRDHKLMFVVRRIEVDYLRPAHLDESLSVITGSVMVGGASVLLRQDVRGPQGSCAVLTVRLACVKPGVAKPGRLPPRWRAALTAIRGDTAHGAGTQGRRG